MQTYTNTHTHTHTHVSHTKSSGNVQLTSKEKSRTIPTKKRQPTARLKRPSIIPSIDQLILRKKITPAPGQISSIFYWQLEAPDPPPLALDVIGWVVEANALQDSFCCCQA